MKVLRTLLYLTSFYSLGLVAEPPTFMGCQWIIPERFEKISGSDIVYRNQVNEVCIESWSPASILFTTYDGENIAYYSELNRSGEAQVLFLRHKAQDSNYTFYSTYFRENHFGKASFLDELLIVSEAEGQVIALSGLQKPEVEHLTSGCSIQQQAPMAHYDIFELFKKGELDLIHSNQDIQILVH
ncbi:hypothetical protein [Alkalimonas amylolytica]|uniref:Uncharacterized protein n=1 Tax=Alkalimonas amylolytica TaxID=152573 RepID=A0A1H4E2V3_ALKAM|nr:hypothetical protein [Alkalimonas amylolytica]SEA79353.1 hypothetical protein SAMN04488051_106188 [Alkalimonas amylolytica]